VELDARYTFDNFVVGSANRLAVAAALAVAESPGTAYNPLFICAAPGLGKTHLVTAIGHHAAALQPALRVDAVTLDEFVRQLHAAVSMGDTPAFRQRFQATGLLLIDDAQFLTGRRETQAELLRLCDEVQGDGRQIVLTGDRPPADIADVDERLTACLSAGLVVDIGVPDYEGRVAILGTWCAQRGLAFGPGTIEALGRVDVRSIRELQGALSRLIAHRAAGGRDAMVGVADVQRLFPECREPPRSSNGRLARTSGASAAAAEFLNFIDEVAHVVARHVEPWRTRLGEAAAWWTKEGYCVEELERALRAETDPESAALIASYERHVGELQALASEATAIDPALASNDVFYDPDNVPAAEALVARARAGAVAHTADEPEDLPDLIEFTDLAEDAARDAAASEPVVASVVDPVVAPVLAPRRSRATPLASVVTEDTFFLDDEKVVWDWPDASGRVIEEFR
jgi:Bacterial dnaA  protein